MGSCGSASSAFCFWAAVAAAAAPGVAHSAGESGAATNPQHGSSSPRLRRDPITMGAFKQAMLNHYSSARDAFAALDARSATDLEAALDEAPLSLEAFVHGTRTFQPPLNKEQATFAFRGLDADGNGQLVVDEFLEGLHAGGFFRASTRSAANSPSKGQGAEVQQAPISMAEFKKRMFRVYKTAPHAFAALDYSETDLTAALDSKPLSLKQFCHGVRSFIPPLTEEQGIYAFTALDVDNNGILVPAEFSEGLIKNHFRALTTTATTTTTITSTTSTTTPTTTVTTSTPMTTSTTTTTTTTSTQALGMSNPLPNAVIITMGDFKNRMLNAHDSALRAFQALDANPCDLERFIRGTKSFKPPLTRQEAEYAFRGLDADHDEFLRSYEFFEVLEFGNFFPTLRDLVVMSAPKATINFRGSATAAHDAEPVSDEGPAEGAAAAPGASQSGTDAAPTAARQSDLLSKVVALAALCPLGCLLLVVLRSFGPRLLLCCGSGRIFGTGSYDAVNDTSTSATSSQSSNRSGTPLVERHRGYPHAGRKRRSRWFGSGSVLGCCIRSGEEGDDGPVDQCLA